MCSTQGTHSPKELKCSLLRSATLDQWRSRMKELDPNSPASAAAVPGLLEIVSDVDAPWFTRRQAALTLGRMGTPAAAH